MEPFKIHSGLVATIKRQDVDTDQIIPKQFLKLIGRTGFGKYLFYDWRFLASGQENTDFELNQPKFKGASILLAGNNFGCGSSREHAPWALQDYGFKVIISSSFADIFQNNCFKNGLLVIVIQPDELTMLYDFVNANPGTKFTVDLPSQTIDYGKGVLKFNLDKDRKEFLINGLDDIKYTLQYESAIKNFEDKQKSELPWLWN